MALPPPSATGGSSRSALGALPIEEILKRDSDQDLAVYLAKKPQEITSIDLDGKTVFIKLAQANARKCLSLFLLQFSEQLQTVVTVADAKGRTALHYLCVNAKPIPKEQQKKEDIHVEKLVLQILRLNDAPYKPDFSGWTPLHYAVSQQHTELVKQFYFAKMHTIAQEEQNIIFNPGTFTPLHLAARDKYDCLLCVSGLTEDMNVPDQNGMMPLHYAVRSPDFQKNIEQLLGNGAKIDALDKNNRTAFSLAMQQGNLGAAELLLARDANPGLGEPNPLLQCYLNGLSDFAEKILVKKTTPAHVLGHLLEIATCREDTAFVKLLTTHGAKSTQVSEGISKLHQKRASVNPTLLVNQILGVVSSGTLSDATKVDSAGNTVLHRALLARNFVLFYFVLSQFKELIKEPNAKGETPLLLAVKLGDRLAVETLLKCGASAKAVDREQNTALHLVSHAPPDHLQVTAIVDILAKKVDLESINKAGQRPLNFAWESCNDLVFNRLLDLKAQVDVAENGLTLLMRASMLGKSEPVERLILAGADRNFKSTKLTPLLAGVQGGHLMVVQLLLDKSKAATKGKAKLAHPNRGLDHVTPITAAIDGIHRAQTLPKTAEKNVLDLEQYKILQLLLKEGADPNRAVKIGPNKETNPLTVATEKKLHDVMQLLLANKAKVNNKAHGNRSPVVVAIKNGDVTGANILIAAGAKASKELLSEMKKLQAPQPQKVITAIAVTEDSDDDNSDRSETTTAVQSATTSAYSSKTVTPRGSPRSRGRYIVSAEEIAARLQNLSLDVNGTFEDGLIRPVAST